jgi:hypothetical protein
LGKPEALWKITQIAAVLVGGYWTWLVFIRTEAPLLEVNSRVDRSLSAPVPHADGCLRTLWMNLVNTGKSAFTVEKAVTRGWKFSMHREDRAFAELMDLERIEAQDPLFTKEFPDPATQGRARWYPFLQRYRAGESYSHDFVFLLKKEAGAWIFLKTEFFLKGEAMPRVGGVFEPVCGEP